MQTLTRNKGKNASVLTMEDPLRLELDNEVDIILTSISNERSSYLLFDFEQSFLS